MQLSLCVEIYYHLLLLQNKYEVNEKERRRNESKAESGEVKNCQLGAKNEIFLDMYFKIKKSRIMNEYVQLWKKLRSFTR